jgi:hypothetical protein
MNFARNSVLKKNSGALDKDSKIKIIRELIYTKLKE